MWIKPSELPEKFHGECWVSWKCPLRDGKVFPPKLYTVQNYYRGICAEYWCDDGYYRSLPDAEYRVMILDLPDTPTDDEWI